jgi:hypothetical protein
MVGGFETLIYTDCRAGQGLSGAAGMQFQAASPGADRGAMALVQQHLLYEAPARYMRERRPVADYPRSFAHIARGYLATACGVYLGREISGAREGNQLTHSIVTKDPGAYGLVRPAQLFEASFWTTRPAPTTNCPALTDRWRPGPFGAAEAKQFVASEPDGERTLVALVSALERVSGKAARRVLFISSHPRPVLRWLTAATLLLPQREALRIGFKVFSTNPATATMPVVAVHPEWSSSTARVDNDLGYWVFDLMHHKLSDVDLSERAQAWVAHFLSEDPFDVVDAIEIAGTAHEPDRLARAIGLAAVLRREPTDAAEAEAIARWLHRGSATLVRAHMPAIVDLLLGAQQAKAYNVLAELFEAAARGRLGDRSTRVCLALLNGELTRAVNIGWFENSGSLPADTWGPAEQPVVRRMVRDALGAAQGGRFIDAVLQVAARFGVSLAPAEINNALGGFIREWADSPATGFYNRDGWPQAESIRLLLREELVRRLEADPSSFAQTGNTWWEHFVPRSKPPFDVLDEALIGTRTVFQGVADRERWVHQALASTQQAPDPGAALSAVARALWSRGLPKLDEARYLHTLLPGGVRLDASVFDRAVAAFLATTEPTAEQLDVLQFLEERSMLTINAELKPVLQFDWWLRQAINELPDLSEPPDRVADRLSKTPDKLVNARCDALYSAMLANPHPTIVLGVLAGKSYLVRGYVDRLTHAANNLGTAQAIVQAFYLISTEVLPPYFGPYVDQTRRDWLRTAIRTWISRIREPDYGRANALAAALGPPLDRQWIELRNTSRKVGIRRLRIWPRGR